MSILINNSQPNTWNQGYGNTGGFGGASNMNTTGGFGQPQTNSFGGTNQNTGAFGASNFQSQPPQNTQNPMNNYSGFMSNQQQNQNQSTGYGSGNQGGNPLFN